MDTNESLYGLPTRFEEKFIEEPNTGCWLWSAGTDKDGYGTYWLKSVGNNVRAHRFSYEKLVGPISDGLHIDHLCRTPCCVNPSHLEPVTCRENTLRGASAEAGRKRMLARTHCKHGHPFSSKNTKVYTRANGKQYRQCIECQRKQGREAQRRRRANRR